MESDGRPTLTTQPASQTAPAGNTLKLAIMAVGGQPLSYQWQCNGTNIEGACGAALFLTNVQPAQAGDYAVVLNNAAGSATSAVATLTVLVPSGILSAPYYAANGAFWFSVAGTAGSNYVIAGSTNLANWLPLETNTSPFTFADTNALYLPLRFYRAQPSP
jgi:hypothetical protein